MNNSVPERIFNVAFLLHIMHGQIEGHFPASFAGKTASQRCVEAMGELWKEFPSLCEETKDALEKRLPLQKATDRP